VLFGKQKYNKTRKETSKETNRQRMKKWERKEIEQEQR